LREEITYSLFIYFIYLISLFLDFPDLLKRNVRGDELSEHAVLSYNANIIFLYNYEIEYLYRST